MASTNPPKGDDPGDTPLEDASERPQVFTVKDSVQSYVYPVRSLLSGRIQPALDQSANSPTDIASTDTQTTTSPSSSARSPASESRLPWTRRAADEAPRSLARDNEPEEAILVDRFGCLSATEDHLERDLPYTTPAPPLNDVLERAQGRDITFNPSERGLVHLPRLDSSSSQEKLAIDNNDVRPATSPLAPPGPFIALPSPGRSASDSGSNSEYFTGSSNMSEEFVNFRFEHKQDENGNHLIIGREGDLQRCEDEPIRTPGAVQAFGVLIAVQEAGETLIVRQVSENSTELLGLSPRYLFSLECFTDTLPEAQADLLWENIQYIRETRSEDDGGPHVFTLLGWGAPGTAKDGSKDGRLSWRCWCAIHPPTVTHDSSSSDLIVMEFEWEKDTINPLYPPVPSVQVMSSSSTPSSSTTLAPGDQDTHFVNSPMSPDHGLDGDDQWLPNTEDILESTTSYSKPLPALERIRKMNHPSVPSPVDEPSLASEPKRRRRRKATENDSIGVGMMDVFAVMGQINEQLGAVDSLDTFLKVVVGVVKDLTEFHRVMVYQFDEDWNGQVVAELVDWSQTRDLYMGLHFPAADIPAQARALYAINKVRLLYDRSQDTARIVVKSKEDLEVPLDMTHCYLRAMSPIHIQCIQLSSLSLRALTQTYPDLANMGVRASMSISIMAFDKLWGLITCHSYGAHGMRVSFAVRQMLRLLSQSISRHVERLSYARRLYARKLVNTMVSDRRATGYIVTNTDDLLRLFDADFGVLVIGDGAKILGPNEHGQEILMMTEYLRLKKFNTILASHSVTKDFPDLQMTGGLQAIPGLLLIPLSDQGTDFIAFLRKGQLREVKWAGKPYKDGREAKSILEPRKSFKTWSEVVIGRSRTWTDEQLETSGVLSLVYGKFIEVWRQRESTSQTTKLTELLLSNASHEVRTPLNHIINYLEMALDGPLDKDARENLRRSHAASKSLLFTINDLLDLTRLERGKETSFNDPFDLQDTIRKATQLYRKEAERRDVKFYLNLEKSPKMVIGDATKIRSVVQNLTANALKYTSRGSIVVSCTPFEEPKGLRSPHQVAVDIVVADTGCGIPADKLENIFREFEQVESLEPKKGEASGVGLGLAVVARIVEQLGGQLRVESKVDEGSRFSFLIPLSLPSAGSQGSSPQNRPQSIEKLEDVSIDTEDANAVPNPKEAAQPLDSVNDAKSIVESPSPSAPTRPLRPRPPTDQYPQLRILIVEDDDINRKMLARRLVLDGHTVVNTTNGQEGLDQIRSDRDFDAVLMDIQMPILNGFDATQKIRETEETSVSAPPQRLSYQLNGRIPIFAVSASLRESQRDELLGYGMDGWILKPVDFRRLGRILLGVTDTSQRQTDLYRPGGNWELGGWLR